MTINSEKELLDLVIELRDRERNLTSVLKQVLNDVKCTVAIPQVGEPLKSVTERAAYDCVIQRKTLLRLLEVENAAR